MVKIKLFFILNFDNDTELKNKLFLHRHLVLIRIYLYSSDTSFVMVKIYCSQPPTGPFLLPLMLAIIFINHFQAMSLSNSSPNCLSPGRPEVRQRSGQHPLPAPELPRGQGGHGDGLREVPVLRVARGCQFAPGYPHNNGELPRGAPEPPDLCWRQVDTSGQWSVIEIFYFVSLDFFFFFFL